MLLSAKRALRTLPKGGKLQADCRSRTLSMGVGRSSISLQAALPEDDENGKEEAIKDTTSRGIFRDFFLDGKFAS